MCMSVCLFLKKKKKELCNELEKIPPNCVFPENNAIFVCIDATIFYSQKSEMEGFSWHTNESLGLFLAKLKVYGLNEHK